MSRSAENTSRCAVETALDAINGKWKGLILYHLMRDGMQRFNALQRRLPGITQRMLTKQLRELEAEELVVRKVYAEVPPRVEYRLSAQGEELRPVIEALRAWGMRRDAARGKVEDGRDAASNC
ncbi:winged helix-turn-helix transcriptional regulator [Luteimonas aquatica]|uniref:winged helix-turn-helix transcriptional regulator n=1 Tax=Luteimonas aquatica TaxID=450364 RepID=UPI001F58B7E9|nr:helix-turn-helix domain-containing protein [Luteimonas aquatica]